MTRRKSNEYLAQNDTKTRTKPLLSSSSVACAVKNTPKGPFDLNYVFKSYGSRPKMDLVTYFSNGIIMKYAFNKERIVKVLKKQVSESNPLIAFALFEYSYHVQRYDFDPCSHVITVENVTSST